MGVIIDAGVDESIKIIEAARQRQEAFVHAEVPFSENAACVAGGFQHGRQQYLPSIHPANTFKGSLVFAGFVFVTVIWSLVSNHIVNAVALRVAPGEQRTARRRARGPRHIKTRELYTTFGESVEVRRLHFVGVETAEIAIALIVGNNQQNIWRRGREHLR